ncbi:hypothetical protein [Virgibacillus salexigens]|uniref:Uncharacterized protein n=1 Tax=Virgibacillus massiliensis TaxID=1462526 RepID=A0A024QHY9_9BACI|nr:hypothetical protein [Virgibacillus massiliensis]CDQ42114.1 hypothetical protein BN990_04494 [Virgibacillus massiliensis]
MYEVVDYTIKDIAIVYIVFISAGLLLSSVSNLLISAISRGTEKWR